MAKENAEAQAKLRTLTGEEDTDLRRSKRHAKEDQDRHRKPRRSENSDRKRSLSHDRRGSRHHRERCDGSEERRYHNRKKHHRGSEDSQEDNGHHHHHKRRRHEDDNDTTGRERHRNKRRQQYEDESEIEHHADHHKRRRRLDEKRPEEKHRSRHTRHHHDKKDRDSSEVPDLESNEEYHRRKSRHANEESRRKHRHEPEKRRSSKSQPDRETRGESFYRQISPNDIVQSIEFPPNPVLQGNGNSQPKSAPSDIETDKDLTDHAGSELLEDLFGPRPPQTTSKDVKTKGRGNLSSVAMDARFTEDYDPSMEMHMDTDQNELEAMRDRQQWRLRGADRLRAAGFSEDVIKNWQNSGEKQEKSVDDVKWAKQGEAREWDRGKVIDEKGDVGLKPKWDE